LTTAAQKIGEKMYSEAQGQQAAGASAEGEQQQAKPDDVVDADFKEVK
jgi:molecular chaperone DnaK